MGKFWGSINARNAKVSMGEAVLVVNGKELPPLSDNQARTVLSASTERMIMENFPADQTTGEIIALAYEAPEDISNLEIILKDETNNTNEEVKVDLNNYIK